MCKARSAEEAAHGGARGANVAAAPARCAGTVRRGFGTAAQANSGVACPAGARGLRHLVNLGAPPHLVKVVAVAGAAAQLDERVVVVQQPAGTHAASVQVRVRACMRVMGAAGAQGEKSSHPSEASSTHSICSSTRFLNTQATHKRGRQHSQHLLVHQVLEHPGHRPVRPHILHPTHAAGRQAGQTQHSSRASWVILHQRHGPPSAPSTKEQR